MSDRIRRLALGACVTITMIFGSVVAAHADATEAQGAAHRAADPATGRPLPVDPSVVPHVHNPDRVDPVTGRPLPVDPSVVPHAHNPDRVDPVTGRPLPIDDAQIPHVHTPESVNSPVDTSAQPAQDSAAQVPAVAKEQASPRSAPAVQPHPAAVDPAEAPADDAALAGALAGAAVANL